MILFFNYETRGGGGRHPYRSERSKRGEGEEERKGKKEGKKKKTASHTDSQSAERGEAAHSTESSTQREYIYIIVLSHIISIDRRRPLLLIIIIQGASRRIAFCMTARGKVASGVGVVRSSSSAAAVGKRGRHGGNRDDGEFNVRALMDIELCPCRTCFAGSSGRPREQQQGSSHKKQRCVLCQAKKAPKQTTNYCARVSHPLWRNRLHLCNTKRWKGKVYLTSNCITLISFVLRVKDRSGVYRTCWYVLHCEDPSIEFRAEVNGYNDRPSEQCIKCTKDKNREIRLGEETCTHWIVKNDDSGDDIDED